MASSSDDKTTIKVIPFDPEDYKKWSHLVTSKAIAHKFGKVFFSKVFEDFKITPEEYYSEQVTDPAGQTVSITKEEKENFELNAKAWSYLEESVKDDPVAYGLLSVIENRNAHKAWRALKTKYDKTGDAIDMTTLENEWNEAKMNNDLEDPDIWFNELERIRGLIKEVAPAIQKNDTVMALKISSNLPHCYIPVYTNLTQVKKQGDLDTVKETVRAHYKAFIKNKTAEELAFINYTPHKERKKYQNRGRGGGQRPKNEETNGKGPWCDFCKRDTHNTDQCYSKDPKCFNCGKSGHLKKDCWAQGGGAYKEQANAASKDDVPCLICNKTGHKAADCSKNKDKEKDKKKSISFAGSAHVANELGVDGKEDIWLVDSGARVHITNDKSGLYNIKRTKTDVIVGDGWTSISPMKGDLRLITDKGYDLILRNVLFIPGFDKNLLSAMKLVENNNQIILDSPDSGYIKQMNSDHSILLTRGEHNMLYLNAFRTLPKTANQATISHDKPSTHTSPLNLQRNPFLSGVVTDDEESDDDDYDNDQPQDQIPRNETYRDVLLKQPKPKHMNANDAHRKFGHCSPNEMKTLAKILNIKLTGKLDPCPACLMAKSQQSRTRKQTINHKPEPGELLGIDLTGPFPPDIHQNKYVAVACDDATRHSWSKPIKTKTELKGFAEELLQKVKKKGITVERIRCDNAPENKKHLLPLCQQNNISLELTAPHTPQFNGKTERCITELWKNTKAVLTAARFTYQYKCDLWSYAWKYVEDTKSPTKNGALFVGKERQQRILSDPIEFGRLGTVDTGKKTKKSMSNRGERVIMIGYGGHTNASDTYLLLKPRTRQIVISRDVKWERWHGLENSSAPILEDIFEPNNDQEDSLLAEESSLPMMADDIRATMRDHPEIMDMDLESVISFEDGVLLDVFDLSDVEESSDDEVNDHLTQGNNIFRSDDASFDSSSDSEFPMEKETVGNGIETENPNENVSNEASRPAKLIDLDNPDVYEGRTRLQQRALDEDQGDIQNRAHFIHSRTTQDINQHRKRIKSETACNAISCDPGTPSSWKELWNNPELRKKWRDSACNEIENFLRRDAWKLFPRKDLNGRKPIGSKYVFKEKLEQDGSTRLKTRIVIKGYTQIPGIDFTETFSPVANDTSIRVAVSYALYKANWIPHVIDIEAAFLEADLDEVIVAEWPEGLKELGYTTEELEKEYCILLNKAMYGTVQAPRAFFLTFTRYLRDEMNLIQSKVDPCLWFKKKGDETELIVAIYVDDCIICGEEDNIKWCKEKIKERFNISDLGKIQKHIGVNYRKDEDEFGTFYLLSMDDYCNKFIEETEELCGNVKLCNTPGFPGTVLTKADPDEEPIKESNYRSLIGTALYLIRKILPEASNAIRDLSQHLENPQATHWKSIMRLAGYLKRNKPQLRIRKPTHWRIIAYTDSNYATDTHDRKSISGMIVTIGGSLVSWASKKQDIVALSSCEAEFIASTFCAQEILFVQQLMTEIETTDDIATLYGDNNGAIFISRHSHVGPRTKHIDVRYHFIRELIMNGKLEYKKVKGEDNPSDIMTKNVTEKCLEMHKVNMRNGTIFGCTTNEPLSREDVEKMCAEKNCAHYATTYDLRVGETQTNGRLCDSESRPANTGAALFPLTDQPKNEDEETENMRKVELEDTEDDSEDDDSRATKPKKLSTSPMEQKGNYGAAVKNGQAGEDKEKQMAGRETD